MEGGMVRTSFLTSWPTYRPPWPDPLLSLSNRLLSWAPFSSFWWTWSWTWGPCQCIPMCWSPPHQTRTWLWQRPSSPSTSPSSRTLSSASLLCVCSTPPSAWLAPRSATTRGWPTHPHCSLRNQSGGAYPQGASLMMSCFPLTYNKINYPYRSHATT